MCSVRTRASGTFMMWQNNKYLFRFYGTIIYEQM